MHSATIPMHASGIDQGAATLGFLFFSRTPLHPLMMFWDGSSRLARGCFCYYDILFCYYISCMLLLFSAALYSTSSLCLTVSRAHHASPWGFCASTAGRSSSSSSSSGDHMSLPDHVFMDQLFGYIHACVNCHVYSCVCAILNLIIACLCACLAIAYSFLNWRSLL